MTTLKLFLICVLLSAVSFAQDNTSSSNITSQELRQHVKFLSSDQLSGRKTGEQGNREAAEYIASEFKRYGLQPAGTEGKYFQEFPFLASVKQGKNSKLVLHVENKEYDYKIDDEFNLQSVSTDTSLSTSLVFAGYGITADSLHYDDYAGIDVMNKIAVILRYTPEGSKNDSRFYLYSALMKKIFNAREHGAAGVILVVGPLDAEKPKLMQFEYMESANAGIAVMSMRWDILDSLFHAANRNLRTIQQGINDTRKPNSFLIENAKADIQTQVLKEYSTSSNILGLLQGNDPQLSQEFLIIGAHMDHLGMGGKGSLASDTVAIHHGADDNASGTAGLLEAAQYLASHREQLKRSILFIGFSGEEMGLLGSNYYTKNPTFPIDHTVAMLNMDMVGRLTDSALVVEGMGTSPEWETIVKRNNKDSLKVKLKPDGFGPSDHASFYAKDLPVMFFFTNLHNDYHRPSDTWDKINYSGEETVVRFVARIATDIANVPTKPAFTKAAVSSMAGMGGDRQGVRVSLGVVPDYAEDVVGMKISGTRPGSAAEKAGLKGGDVIISFGAKTIKNIYDFTYLLGEYKPGDEVAIIIKRDTTEITLKAILEARK